MKKIIPPFTKKNSRPGPHLAHSRKFIFYLDSDGSKFIGYKILKNQIFSFQNNPGFMRPTI